MAAGLTGGSDVFFVQHLLIHAEGRLGTSNSAAHDMPNLPVFQFGLDQAILAIFCRKGKAHNIMALATSAPKLAIG